MKILRNFVLVLMIVLGVGLCFNPVEKVHAASGVGTVKNVKKSKVKYVQSKKINGKKCSGNYRTISWKKVKGADGYIVYRYDDLMNTWNKILKTKKNSFIVSSLLEDETMTIKIQAYKGSTNGDFSKPLKYREKNTICLTRKGKVMTKGCYAEGKDGYFEYASKQAFIIQNQYRTEKGIAPLVWSNELYEVAKLRSKELTRLYSHTRPDGSYCRDLFVEYFGKERCKKFQDNYRELRMAAGKKEVRGAQECYCENADMGSMGPLGVMNEWKLSSGHYATILDGRNISGAMSCYVKNNVEFWIGSFACIDVDNVK